MEYQPIRQWSQEDRPREKLLLKGKNALSDAELIAILLGSGSRGESAVDLARKILQSADNKLHELGKMEIKQLSAFKGIGEAKALTLMAALELGRRRRAEPTPDRLTITTSRDAYAYAAPWMQDLPHEEFHIILLNRANQIIGRRQISSGGVSGTVVDVKLIFKEALQALASGIIALHNHPSGNLKPSDADIKLTQKIHEGARLLDIRLLDHLIISGDKGYYSFADEAML